MNIPTNQLIGLGLGVACFGLIAFVLLSGRKSKVEMRVESLSGRGTSRRSERKAQPPGRRGARPKFGGLVDSTSEGERSLLRIRLIKAGYYNQQAMGMYLGAKLFTMTAPALIGVILGLIGLFPIRIAAVGGGCLGIIGMVGPSFWLDRAGKKRQQTLNRSLPDALDLLVICLEGGLTLQSGLNRISEELKTAHTELANEFAIVQREVQMGLPDSEAISHMGTRTDLDELKSLSTVIAQAEHFGSSLVRALKIHAASSREHRRQKAEEMAQKAGTKILFPTLLFIFPSIFVVILGPAFFQIVRAMGSMMH